MAHAIDVAFQLFVGVYPYPAAEGIITVAAADTSLLTVLRLRTLLKETTQHPGLQFLRSGEMLLQVVLTKPEHQLYYGCNAHLGCKINKKN